MSEESAQKNYTKIEVMNSPLSVNIGHLQIQITKRAGLPHELRLKDAFPRNCHAQLDWLLENTDLTALDLLKAKKQSALAYKDGDLVRQHVVFDGVMGWLLLSILIAMLFGLARTALLNDFPAAQHMAIYWLSTSGVITAMLFIGSTFFFPQSTARRAMLALQRRSIHGHD